MKYFTTIILLIIFSYNTNAQGGYIETVFFCEKVDTDEYNFGFSTAFTIGSGGPPAFSYDIITQNDTLNIRAFYNMVGVFAQFYSFRYDVVAYNQPFPAGINYIKMSSNLSTSTGVLYDVSNHICDVATLSSISFNQAQAALAISPNPTSNQFSISDKVNFDKITIVNNLGQIVKRVDKSKDGNYDVSDLPSGIYYLSYSENSRKIGQVKMVKQ